MAYHQGDNGRRGGGGDSRKRRRRFAEEEEKIRERERRVPACKEEPRLSSWPP
jgi:hypothetical protein